MTQTSAATKRQEIRPEALAALRRLVGNNEANFRDGQFEAIAALVNRRARTLVVERTGWGKSAVYFVATALLRARGSGPTLIVSPLLALMRDQIAAARRAGIAAEAINSTNPEDWRAVFEALRANQIDVLLISPERLNNPSFREEYLSGLSQSIGLLVVDEAHCISDWGHDFRPDYRRIQDLLTNLPTGIPVIATTATANARVVRDVHEQLSAAASGSAEVTTIRGSLARESLRLGVLELPEASDRAAWLIEHLPNFAGSGIIYTLTVAAAEDLAALLTDAGMDVRAYTSRVSADERPGLEDDLKMNRVKALVATSALGMGFDKPDLSFVIHFGAPSSPIAYYQQIGRAGRATERADVLLMPGPEDEAIWRYFASVSMPREDDVSQVLAAMEASTTPWSLAALETVVDVRRTRLELLLKVLDVEGSIKRVRGGWETTGKPWIYDHDRYDRVADARVSEQRSMREFLATPMCRMEFLQRALDDSSAKPCGRCDRCAVPWFSPAIGEASTRRAKAQLARAGVVLDPRMMWPSGMKRRGVPVSGRISADVRVEQGRCLARLTDLTWGDELRGRLDAPGSADAALPQRLLDAVIEVLRDWQWETRPVAIAAVPSHRHPLLVESLRVEIARRGHLLDLGNLELRDGHPGDRGGNSAFRLAGIWNRFTVGEQTLAQLPLDGPVLLVDDLVDSRWTMTVAGLALRVAGFGPVLPFALALAG